MKLISVLCIALAISVLMCVATVGAFAAEDVEEPTADNATSDLATDDVAPGDSANQTMWIILVVLSLLVIGVSVNQRGLD